MVRQAAAHGYARPGWPVPAAPRSLSRLPTYSSTARGMTSKYSRLARLRLVVHELRQRLGRRIGQPLIDRQAVAFGLADLLAVLVEEQLIGHALGRLAAQDAADPAGQFHGVDQVLAGHLVVDGQRIPAHRPVGLPLQLAGAALDRGLERLAGRGVLPGDGAGGRVDPLHRHLHDDAGMRMHRQDRRVGGLPFRPQGRQDGRHDRVVAFQDTHQGGVEAAGLVVFGGGGELVLETERIQERAQPGVVVRAEAVMGAERVGNLRQRLAEVRRQQLLVRDIVRHLAETVHVVAERQQLRRAGR